MFANSCDILSCHEHSIKLPSHKLSIDNDSIQMYWMRSACFYHANTLEIRNKQVKLIMEKELWFVITNKNTHKIF